MANRRTFGSGNYGGGNTGGGGYNQGNRGNYSLGGGLSGVSPWQSGSSPGRSGLQGGNNSVPSLLPTNNILNKLTNDSSLAIATKLLTAILPIQQPVQQPPSLMSLNNSYGNSSVRYGGGNFTGDRFRRNDRRIDNFRNRRQANDRNKDRKSGGDNKARADKTKTKANEKDKIKKEAEEDVEDERGDEVEDKAENQEESQKEENEKEEGPIPEYENIPNKLFHCHVCGKSMWNDVSFDTHIKGRNHRNKLRDLEENYQMQTDLMRQIAAMSLKLEELRRGGKRRPYPDQYCKMCDLHFNGMTMFAHRSTSEHQNLKRFIHPSCEMCKIDFQVRIEYDEHILTPQHLQQEAKALLRKEKFEKDPFYIKLREQEAKLASLSDETADVKEKGFVVLSAEDKTLIQTLMSENETLPDYDPDSEALVAEHFVIPQSGYFCKACKLFVMSSECVDVHCRTVSHYNNYIEVLKQEATKAQKAAEAEGDSENDKRKSDSNEDNSGNWKRRKVDNKNNEVNGGKKYDPEETLDESMEEFTSETSAGVTKAKAETSEAEGEKEEEKASRTGITTRRTRGRAAKK
ncbi:hypothetical protein RUM43_002964 [Polyplax serrata]